MPNKYHSATYELQLQVIDISHNYLEDLFKIIIQYYNQIEKIRPILLETEQTDWQYSPIDDTVYDNLYIPFYKELKSKLEEMLEEVYSTVSSWIKEVYGNSITYPVSKISFFNRDGLDIDDRIEKWWNPYKNKQLRDSFIRSKLTSENKISQIAKAESLNEMEIVKYDKLFFHCKEFEIANEDDEADCYENIHCEVYWGFYKPEDELPPFPLYHPDCECFMVYYL